MSLVQPKHIIFSVRPNMNPAQAIYTPALNEKGKGAPVITFRTYLYLEKWNKVKLVK